ncbi:hypothetical protein B7P43_G05011 [Cryptotermes secundus]|uniref:oleoyl-[acyl-carrier-protein] hydrolase n=3 Tax=Cryptotermes secundus TaxID=105785 RepID=A0A2J7PQY0_9NEOP|nr:hypothetical protein B7P43_G05011 [Cryptotermes secundus]
MDLNMAEVKIEDHKLKDKQECTLLIASNILLHRELLQTAVNALADGACILAREKVGTESELSNGFRLETMFEKTLKEEKLLLLRKGVTLGNPVVIHVTGHNYDWLPEVQTAIRSSSKRHVILVVQGEPLSGVVGLVNCIRKEPGSDYVRCFFILDSSAPQFDVNLPLYQQQLKKDLVMNVYSGGKWGSYQHLPLDGCATVSTPHVSLKIMTPGDLSSFRWLEGNLVPESVQTTPDEELVQIYYSALNFGNVVLATGKVAANFLGNNQLSQDNVQGMEFSGRDQKGCRVMGMMAQQALASMVLADTKMLWKVPDHWTLEDAATVPVVYSTAYYALVMVGGMKKGESVLIHSGGGGVGLAAINICLHAGCMVYTTVGTKEKREFIKKQYPQLTDRNIGNSRDTSFEHLVLTETNGRGVDLVLNSLSEDKQQASIRCLAPRGRFLEIGKFDLANNSFLGLEVFLRETSFHGVMLDKVTSEDPETLKILQDIVTQGISAGVVRPLPRTVFPYTEVEQAFRYMTTGKHVGKVLMQFQPEEDSKVVVPAPRLMQAYPQYFCNPSYSYIIAGGLGGFGLELADWLVLRGARKLVLSSRSGVRTGYQSFRVRTWRSYGVKVVISLADITTKSGVRALLSEANRLGQVDAIFNLAVVLRDAFLENQTKADFVTSAGPKAIATRHLDELSRQMCPHLRHFVVFSSVTCGCGNTGQTNYGMNNSIMERICEARVRDGLPGLAVQWGAVGDVGLVAEMQEKHRDRAIGGLLMQRIASCLEVLDIFMRQSCPIVASMVVADKHSRGSGSTDIVQCCRNIMGICDLKTIELNKTLLDLGMDSMTAVAIKQTLEREFDIYLTLQEIRNLTFAGLEELGTRNQKTEAEKQSLEGPSVDDDDDDNDDGPPIRMQLLLHVLGDEASSLYPVVRLPSAAGAGADVEDELKAGPVLFMLPGVEGVASVLEPLAKNLKYQAVCLQLNYRDIGQTAHDIAQSLLPHIHSRLAPGAPFRLLGYSYGVMLALELALALEAEGREGHLYLVDHSPDYAKSVIQHILGTNEEQFDINFICTIYKVVAPQEATSEAVRKLVEKITPMKSREEKLDHVISMLLMPTGDKQHYKTAIASIFARMKNTLGYEWNPKKRVKSQTTLLKARASALKAEEDYGLSKICEKKVEVHVVPGNHVTVLGKKETAAIINRQVTDSEALKFKNSLNEEHILQ